MLRLIIYVRNIYKKGVSFTDLIISFYNRPSNNKELIDVGE